MPDPHFQGLGPHDITFRNSSTTHDRVVAFTEASPDGVEPRFTVRQCESRRFRNMRFPEAGPYVFFFTVVNSSDGGDAGNGGITVDLSTEAGIPVNQAYTVELNP